MNDASPMAHAEYGMSSLDRWTSCLGSIKRCAGLPSFDNEWSAEGTLAHKHLQACLLTAQRTADSFPETPSIQSAVQVALDYVFSILDKHPDAEMFVEQRVAIPTQAVPGRMWGTADVVIYIPSLCWIFVIDYKHGVGIFVDTAKSKQLRGYGVGAMAMFEGRPIKGVTLAIVQPRSYSEHGGIRPHDITTTELFYFHNFMEDKAYATLDPDAPIMPTPDNCRFCPAGGAGTCEAVHQTALAIVGGELQSVRDISKATLPEPSKLPLDRIIAIMSLSKLMTGFLKNCKEFAVGFARAGNVVPGFKLVFSQSRRGWNLTLYTAEQIAHQLALLTGKTYEECHPRTLPGITEAENMVIDAFRSGLQRYAGESQKSFTVRQNKASEMASEAMALLTLKQPGGGIDLVPIGDPRAPVDGAATYFAGIVNMEGLK